MINDYATLTVGQQVAVARTGSWRTGSEGVYTVVKVNKMKVVLRRLSDGYERVFSVKRRVELNRSGGSYNSAYLETVDSMTQREAQQQQERDRKQAWRDAEAAAARNDLAKLKELVAKLEQMAV